MTTRAELLNWYEKEFGEISDQIKKSDSLSLYNFLRIRNYKLQNISIESEEHISEITREAFKLAKEDKIKEAIEKLIELKGVRIPIASTILAMKFSNFAIIDQRVIKELFKRKLLKNYTKNRYLENYTKNSKTYESYLLLLREKAKKYKMKLRELEFLLFKESFL